MMTSVAPDDDSLLDGTSGQRGFGVGATEGSVGGKLDGFFRRLPPPEITGAAVEDRPSFRTPERDLGHPLTDTSR